MPKLRHHTNALSVSSLIAFSIPGPVAAQPYEALSTGKLGLYDVSQFRLADGRCKDCVTVPQALWYFQDELIAVPSHAASQSAIGFDPTLQAQNDVRAWVAGYRADAPAQIPSLVWLGSPQAMDGIRLADQGSTMIDAQGQRMPFAVVPKIPTNLSYYNERSIEALTGRALHLRGRMSEGRFVARTIWPEDYALDFARLPLQPLKSGETLQTLVRADGAKPAAPLAARILWQRDANAPRDWAHRPALSFILNGAQGDDDEAHGGHFAVATGYFGARGEWNNWMVNNFYNLDWYGEKGILASMLPMHAYMADLNSGQSWYRPSYMLVAVLKKDRSASMYQQAIGRVFNHLYRHDFHYRHTTANCTGLSMATLRSIGWQIPRQGPTNRMKGIVGLPWVALTEWNLDNGRKAYDYLTAEQTELYPLSAFEAAGQDLLGRITVGKPAKETAGTPFERMLRDDVEALIYVNIPQFPSSRAFGQAPVASIDEYMDRIPKDKSKWKIIPVLPRPFPAELKDTKAPAEPLLPSTIAIGVWLAAFILIGLGVGYRRLRKRAAKE